MLQDPLNDAMAVIRNAELAGKGECRVRPASKLVGWVLDVMKSSDYILGFERVEDARGGLYMVRLKGNINNCGVIKPRAAGRRTDHVRWEARQLPAPELGALIRTTA